MTKNPPSTQQEEYLRPAEQDEYLNRAAAQMQIMREAAKQLGTLLSLLPTLYFAVISFSDLHKVVRGVEALPFILPPVPWIGAFVLITGIFIPKYSPKETIVERINRMDRVISSYKQRLDWAYRLLVIGLALLLIVQGYYLWEVPAPPK